MNLAYFRSLAARFFRRSQTENELDEELRAHLQLRADDLERSGLGRIEAERRARIEFGGHERFKEECREAIAGNFIDILIQDLRFSLRTLARQPVFAVVAIVTLAIGIGMTTAMLSIVHDVLIRPLPYVNSERLYAIYTRSDSAGQTRIAASGPDYLDYREQNKSFVHIAEYLPQPMVSADVITAISHALRRSHAADAHGRHVCKVFSLVRRSGGMGGTFLAIQTALSLLGRNRKGSKAHVCLVDLNFQSAVSAIYLDVDANHLSFTDQLEDRGGEHIPPGSLPGTHPGGPGQYPPGPPWPHDRR